MPFGPVVVALTRPLPAVTDADALPLPLVERETVQPSVLPVTVALLVPPELPTLTELLTWAFAIDAQRPTKKRLSSGFARFSPVA